MANELENIGLDSNEFDPSKADRVRQLMRANFPVTQLRLLTGVYTELVNYYVTNRFRGYNRSQAIFEDLAELVFEDFADWNEQDFKRVDANLLRDLRNHLIANGIAIEKRAGLPIARAISNALSNAEEIPYRANRNIRFVCTPVDGVTVPPNNINNTSSNNQPSSNGNGSPEQTAVPTQSLSTSSTGPSMKLVDITKCAKRELIYRGLPDEDFDAKRTHFLDSLKLCRINSEADKLMVLPFFLGDQAALTFRTSIRGKVNTIDEAFTEIKRIFLTEEARRANDAVWESLNFESVRRKIGSNSKREVLRTLFEELERLRTCTSSAATATPETTDHITRAKLLSSVSGVSCFTHVRANPPTEYLRLRSALYDAATQADTGAVKETSVIEGSLYTDRKYNARKNTRGSQSSRIPPKQKRYAGNNRECYVCGEKECHSSNHTREERERSKKGFRNFLSEALWETDEENEPDEISSEEKEDWERSSLSTAFCGNSLILSKGADPSRMNDFLGIALDTACSHVCTASLVQYTAYCKYTGQKPNINRRNVGVFNTSGGVVKSIGTTRIIVPFGKLADFIVLDTHIFGKPSIAPILLSYQVMKEKRLNMMIPQKRLVSEDDTSKFVEFTEICGVPMYQWHPSKNITLRLVDGASLFTIRELRNIHRRTGHQSPSRMMKFLERHPNDHLLTQDTRAMLNRIVRSCKACQMHAKPPQRFRFVIHDEARFNHVLQVDIMKLSDGNVLHVICEGTRYQLGVFVPKITSEACWDALRKCWINVLSGVPDIIRADAGKQFDAKSFRDNAKAAGVYVEIVPTEAHNKIGKVERYHSVVRRVYEKLKTDDPDMSPELRLSTTFRCINDSAGPDGLVPTLLVFGTYPKLGIKSEAIAPTTIERANAIRDATELAESLMRKERLRRAAKDGPSANKSIIEQVKRLERDAPVLVYREKLGWQGPLDFIAADDHGVWVRNEKGNETRLALHVVKPYVPEQWAMFNRLRSPLFLKSREKELEGLFARNAVKLVSARNVRGKRLYRGRWVESVKPNGEAKSRMVICATNEKLNSMTYSPTVRRISTRIGFAFASCFPEVIGKCRDITQAFVQSDTNIRREIYLELPHEIREKNKGMVLHVMKPLYGLPESPINWYTTYVSHFKKTLQMDCSPHDPCLLIRKKKRDEKCDGIVLLQVDDSLTFGTSQFHEEEKRAAKRFDNHGARQLGKVSMLHNGAKISFENGIYRICQSDIIGNVKQIDNSLDEERAFDVFRSMNAMAAYPASLTRPDLLYNTSKFSQITKEKFSNRTRRSFNKFVSHLKDTADTCLKYVPLENETVHVAVYTDASFTIVEEEKSQLGVVVVLRDGKANANLIHASSIRARRRARSVLSAEIFALLDGFDAGYVVRKIVSQLLGREVELHIFTDSRSAFHVATTLVRTREKRLMLDVHLLREAYEKREITQINWISGDCNIADPLTKMKNNGSLLTFVRTNKLLIEVNGWVDRDVKPVHITTDISETTIDKQDTDDGNKYIQIAAKTNEPESLQSNE